MNATRRLIIYPAPTPDSPPREDLIWRDPPGPSSFHTSISPSLGELGPMPPRSRDLVWLTTTVFVADRTVKRPTSKTREISLDVPVSAPQAWADQVEEIEAILSSFSSDSWRVQFRPAPAMGIQNRQPGDAGAQADLVCLLSGGADSLCGAVKALHEGRRPILVSHWDTDAHKPIQQSLVSSLREFFDVEIEHRQIRVARRETQIGGQRFPNETTKRCRSLLFLALGLAHAAATDIDELWIPENGWASLNPPLAPERLGAMSTRTTDPLLLRRFDRVLAALEAHHGINNPFQWHTKGEMFADVAAILGASRASELLSATHSCSHSRLAGQYGKALTTQCGVCFGCLLRRAAFDAGGIEDRTPYLDTTLSGADLAHFRNVWSGDLRAMAYATTRGIAPADLLALQIPASVDLDEVKDLLTRGLVELEAVTP